MYSVAVDTGVLMAKLSGVKACVNMKAGGRYNVSNEKRIYLWQIGTPRR